MGAVTGWPSSVDGSLDDLARAVGRTELRRFGDRLDSRSTVLGVEVGGRRAIVKHATDPEAIGWLHSAVRFHTAVRHPAIPTIVHGATTGDGFAIVEEWAPGEILVDGYDRTVLGRDDPESAYQRFLARPPDELAAAVDQIIDAHVAVADAGFVAVDLYDGCVLYDFPTGRVHLVDLDHYRPGPYVLEVDRQIGSTSVMAPEELVRGATIDERATVFTLGRFAQVYLGCARNGPGSRNDFRGTDTQYAVTVAACRPEPADRIPTVRDLRDAWSQA